MYIYTFVVQMVCNVLYLHLYLNIFVYSGIISTPMIPTLKELGCLRLYVFRWGVIDSDDFQEFGSWTFYFQNDGEIS